MTTVALDNHSSAQCIIIIVWIPLCLPYKNSVVIQIKTSYYIFSTIHLPLSTLIIVVTIRNLTTVHCSADNHSVVNGNHNFNKYLLCKIMVTTASAVHLSAVFLFPFFFGNPNHNNNTHYFWLPSQLLSLQCTRLLFHPTSYHIL